MLLTHPADVPVGQLLSRSLAPGPGSIIVEGMPLILSCPDDIEALMVEEGFPHPVGTVLFTTNISPAVVSAGKLAPAVLCRSPQLHETRGPEISAV